MRGLGAEAPKRKERRLFHTLLYHVPVIGSDHRDMV